MLLERVFRREGYTVASAQNGERALDLLKRQSFTAAIVDIRMYPVDGVTLLGEKLIAWRDTDGRLSLLDRHCPHRRAELYFARNEQCGLRCSYHGWKFDVDGNVLEMPAEPENTPLLKEIKVKSYYYGEEVGYWNHGDTALIVNTPKYGRKVFTGKTHMPTPSKFRWVTNVNVLNNSKHHYDMVKNVDTNIECIITQDIEMTSDVNHADVAFACNSWMEFT